MARPEVTAGRKMAAAITEVAVPDDVDSFTIVDFVVEIVSRCKCFTNGPT